MLKKFRNALVAVAAVLFLYSCEQEEIKNEDLQAIKAGIYELGYDPITDIHFDGDKVIIDDIIYTLEQVKAMIHDHNYDGPETEQTVVNANQRINTNIGRQVNIDGSQRRLIKVNTIGLSGNMIAAVQTAINDYNNFAGIDIRLELSSFSGDINIFNSDLSFFGSLGQAQFPLFGNPGSVILIDENAINNNNNLNNNFRLRLAFHEIGHTLGLRHTDWQTRQSCGQNVTEPLNVDGIFNQGPRGSGLVQVPGTTTGSGANFQTFSVMNACVNFFNDNDPNRFTFTVDDRTALQFMYPIQ